MNFIPKTFNSKCTFANIQLTACKYIESLSSSRKEHLQKQLEHGAGLLKSKEGLYMYLYSYGEIHKDKLILLLKHLPMKIWTENHISVIDYGCGQGVAEMVLSDYLKGRYLDNTFVRDFTLIDPSLVNLESCKKILPRFFSDSLFRTICKTDKQLRCDDMAPKCETVLHIFSNIIDLPEFEGSVILDYLNCDNAHNNIVACVSPYYPEHGRGDRMSEFCSKLKGFNLRYHFEKHVDEWDENFSCQIQIYTSLYY
jgi:hypothetical protein